MELDALSVDLKTGKDAGRSVERCEAVPAFSAYEPGITRVADFACVETATSSRKNSFLFQRMAYRISDKPRNRVRRGWPSREALFSE